MNPTAALAYIVSNPWTSTPGAIGLMHGVGATLTAIAAGKNILDAVSPNIAEIVASLGLLAAKDVNVTGGAKKQ